MATTVEKVSVTGRWINCSCCGEQIRSLEKYFQVKEDGRNVPGERYCTACEEYAYENNPGLGDENSEGERHLRDMEAYAAYRAAGCTEAFWTDRDAGYI